MSNQRKKISMNRGWKFFSDDLIKKLENTHAEIYGFAKAGNLSFARADFDDSEWEDVNLPHDFVVGKEFDESAMCSQGYKKRGIGIYRKCFFLDEQDKDKQLLIEFGAVCTYSTIYFNGSILERNWDGYNEFTVDITDRALFGETPNVMVVRVDAEAFQGWWYEGAGIYRDVWLYKKPLLHIAHNGVYVNPAKEKAENWLTDVETTIENEGDSPLDFKLISKLFDSEGKCLKEEELNLVCESMLSVVANQKIDIANPKLWDIDTPVLYTLKSGIYLNGELIDEVDTRFGYRTIAVDADTGFYLNGRNIKLMGTCNHQDHAGIGVALPKSVIEYRIRRLKEMGSNAYRSAHGNSGLVKEVCDELGMLVMEENRVFESSNESLARIKTMVKTSRNHPSVVMYCIFNEEDLQGTPMGRRISRRLMSTIKQFDDTRPITAAMNYGHMEEEGSADILDIAGFNYAIYKIDEYKKKHPTQPIIGTENNSALSSRGVYKSDNKRQILNSYDEEVVDWGNLARENWEFINTRPFLTGYFIWTGFDYRGEPTPFQWPSINSYFGILDTCGFAKDSFYLHKAFWSDAPMVHIVPSHWTFKEGELENNIVKVMSHSNCEECELFLNGKSLGRKENPIYKQAVWEVEYQPGTLEMIGYRGNKEVAKDIIKTSGVPEELKLELTKNSLNPDFMDAMPVNVCAVDTNGGFVPFADNDVTFELIGGGEILGVGNGNPTSLEADKAGHRKLWNGRCQVIIGRVDTSVKKPIKLIAKADGLKTAEVNIPVNKVNAPEYMPSVNFRFINKWSMTTRLSKERPDPNMKIDLSDMNTWERIEVGYGSQKIFEGEGGYAVFRTAFEIGDTKEHFLHFNLVYGIVEVYVNGREVFKSTEFWTGEIDVPVNKDENNKVNVVLLVNGKDGWGGIAQTVVLK